MTISTTLDTQPTLSITARLALSFGGTRASGSVLGAARTRAKLADGGWGQTEQAQRQLLDAISDTVRNASDAEVEAAAIELVTAVRSGALA